MKVNKPIRQSATINLRLPAEEKKVLVAISKAQGVTVSQVVRELIRIALAYTP